MSKLIRFHSLNMFSLLYVNYTSIRLIQYIYKQRIEKDLVKVKGTEFEGLIMNSRRDTSPMLSLIQARKDVLINTKQFFNIIWRKFLCMDEVGMRGPNFIHV